MQEIIATIFRIVYQTEDGYTVMHASIQGRLGSHTIVGTLPEIRQDATYKFSGEWVIHPKYGEQFKVSDYEEMLPTTAAGIICYLSSGLIPGIGLSTAGKIVREFGPDTLDIIDKDPEQLLIVNGIGKKKAQAIVESLQAQKNMREVMVFLNANGVGIRLATKIYKEYGDEAIQKIKENPYCLTDIHGIGFVTADELAQKIGFGHETYARLMSGLKYTLLELSKEGHCYATQNMLIEKGVELLDVDASLLSMTLDEMRRVEDVITDASTKDEENAIYLPMFYYAEIGVANRLKRIFDAPIQTQIVSIKEVIDYDEVQKEAIETAVNSKVFVLTGGPGTGKTTTTLGIINALKKKKILLAAPTGRAAKRLSESTGMEAKTIHRLLEANANGTFAHNQDNPLDGDVLIVDECSMIDIILMNNLLKAVPDHMQVILVGDVDQLPSVGPGTVLRDIIDSGRFPIVRLKKIFRQAAHSRIIQNAHRVNEGEMPDWTPRDSDFFFVNADVNAENYHMDVSDYVLTAIGDLVADKLPRYYGISPMQIQVLTPMKQRQLGTVNLNQYLQKKINPGNGGGLSTGAVTYRFRDKVMQTANNYDKDVYNGDIGYVEEVHPDEQKLIVNFDGKRVEYRQAELDELSLAYAVTIHKSQGSEYPVVVMPFCMSHYVLLQRNLLYTGITRAKNGLIIVGQKKAVAYAVNNNIVPKRNTMLKERLAGD